MRKNGCERLLVGHGDDVYEGAKDNMARIFAGPRAQSDNELQQAAGHQETWMKIYPKGVTPECFYRGSTLLTTTLSRLSKGRGSSPSFAWIPAKCMRE
jgi:hypothetical protein